MLYRNFATQEELDAKYDLENTVEDISLYADLYAKESEKVQAEVEHHLDVSFGPTLAEHLDLYTALGVEQPAPVLVYLHEGYWRSQPSKEFGFVTRGPASRGVVTVVVNYALCLEVTIDETVRQVRAALVWTYKGARKGRVHDQRALRPRAFSLHLLQSKLQLTWDQVLRNSPILRLPNEAPSLLVACGEDEPSELRRQSEDCFAVWRAKGLPGDLLPPVKQEPLRHHRQLTGRRRSPLPCGPRRYKRSVADADFGESPIQSRL